MMAPAPSHVESTNERTGHAYRTQLMKLEKKVIVEVSEEDDSGKPIDSRRIELNHIEEASVGAPRAAEALVKKKAVTQTQTAENLTGSETRQYGTIPTETLFGIGLGGAVFPNSDTPFAYGGELRLEHQAPRFGIGGAFRIMGGENDAPFFTAVQDSAYTGNGTYTTNNHQYVLPIGLYAYYMF